MRGPRYVSLIGASRASAELAAKAEELGELLAARGLVVVCGGREGVMEAVARGVRKGGGVSIGILPEDDRELDGVRRATTPAEAVELALMPAD
jgi:uncharacterized protein (TIGR00725 family)